MAYYNVDCESAFLSAIASGVDEGDARSEFNSCLKRAARAQGLRATARPFNVPVETWVHPNRRHQFVIDYEDARVNSVILRVTGVDIRRR